MFFDKMSQRNTDPASFPIPIGPEDNVRAYRDVDDMTESDRLQNMYMSRGGGDPGYAVEAPSSKHFSTKSFSIKRSTVYWSLAILAIIIAAIVGGGVGGSLAVKRAKDEARRACDSCNIDSENANDTSTPDDTSTTPPTSSSQTSPPDSQISTAEALFGTSSAYILPTQTTSWGGGSAITILPIPRRENFDYLAATEKTFEVFWQKDHKSDDLVSVLTSTIELCIEACANVNNIRTLPGLNPTGVECKAAVWVPGRTGGQFAENCFLKHTLDRDVFEGEDSTDTVWTAIPQ